jgi:predicted ribosome quality control (RQC) complex YloA/Tae2 family protein
MVNFREYVTASGLRVLGGKSAESNDELVSRAGRNDVMLHTIAAGSPFVNIGEKPSKKDLKEAAVFCAKYSQAWREGKKDVAVNKFLRSDMKKGIFSKVGSWKVKKSEKIVVKAVDVLKFEKKLRAEGKGGNEEDLE